MSCFPVLLLCVYGANGPEAVGLTLDQHLIVACYNVDVQGVVKCLRDGAKVNAIFGNGDETGKLFFDRWTGEFVLGGNSRTPLSALASARAYPPPPKDLGDIWEDRNRASLLLTKIPRKELTKRARDAISILNVLLSNKCNVNYADHYGATALFRAADMGKVEMVELLLRFGANPNTKTSGAFYLDGPDDTTPLHVAGRSRRMVELLLSNGADATAKDSQGRTPIDWIMLLTDRKYDVIETSKGWKVQTREVKRNLNRN